MAVIKSQSARRPSKRPRLDTHLPSLSTKNTECGECRLCNGCEKINFHSFLVPSSVKPFTFVGLSRDPACPFCSYVRRIARDESGAKISDEVLDDCKFRIEQRTVPVMDRLRASQMLVAPRLVIYAYLYPSDGSLNPTTCLAMLELDGKEVTPIWRANAFWTSRRPRGPCFDITMLRNWMDTARQTEEHGKPFSMEADEASLQSLIGQRCFRVLDVTTNQVVALNKFEPFYALSYVWGRSNFASMIKHDFQKATPRPDHLKVCWVLNDHRIPKTIRDAMSLVERLGEKYLWVDSICISQASTDDKAAVIHGMRSIYRSAVLTIVAADGNDADAGLQRLTCQNGVEQSLVIPEEGRLLHLYPAMHSLDDTIKSTVWNGRGWTFQERVLSRACVYFTRNEVLFSSRGIIERETYVITNNPERPMSTYRRKTPSIGKQATLQGALSQPITTLDHKIHRYKEAVTEFTKRKLTHLGDRFDAFSGILALLVDSDQTEEELQALSGLLYSSAAVPSRTSVGALSGSEKTSSTRIDNAFLESLLWRPDTPVTTDARIPHNAMRTRALPTWSWTGWACETHYPKRDKRSIGPGSTVLLNENNIQLTVSPDERYHLWPHTPSPSELSIKEAFILHLWRPLLRGRLILREVNVAADTKQWSSYEIALSDSKDLTKQLCMIDVAHEFVRPHPEDHMYEFVPVDWGEEVFSPRDLLLVRRKGEYFERIALSYGTPVWLEHLRNVESEHIQLI